MEVLGDDKARLFPTVDAAPTALGSSSAIAVLEPGDLRGMALGSDLLIVDDDLATLTAYEAALAPLGRRIVVAGSGAAALARLDEQDFALVVLDVAMPEMNGLETARQIRQRPRNKALPILFITGIATSPAAMLEAYDAGAVDFVIKPILPEVLRAKVRVHLQLQDRTRAIARASADELLAMLSHELRNPLSAMIGAVEVMKLRTPSGRELAIVERQVDQLTRILDDLLDLSRLTRGGVQLQREPVALAAVVGAAVDLARPIINARGQELTVRVPDSLRVDADRRRLQQVLENLLVNAVKYTGDRGRIEIAAETEGTQVRIAVRDNGRGISEALLPVVFQPFVQGEPAHIRRDGGLGIGLTLVEALVDLHGATIQAQSDGPGTGATFTLRWPSATPVHAGTGAATGTTAARRILVVDDNVDAAEMLAALLRASGHDIVVAHHGLAALELARDFAPEVALLDLGLPEIDGFELARRLRRLPACRDTLLVAVTGYGQPEDRRRSRDAGFLYHLVKPVALATLEALLARPGDV